MSAIVYARVSTEDQARHGYSLADQIYSCKNKARELGYSDVIECVDEGVSGSVLNRPGLERARTLVRAGNIELFIALDPDRLARNLSHQLLITEELDRARVKLEFVNFEWRDTPEGRLFYSLRGAIAEFEREKIKERTMRGKLQKARQGKISTGSAAYGYRCQDSELVIHPETAAIVKLIFQWASQEGLGPSDITRRLNEVGILAPKGGKWMRASVYRILTNKTYTGHLYVNRFNFEGVGQNRYHPKEQRKPVTERPKEQWIDIESPTIIDDATFAAVQDNLSLARSLHPSQATRSYLLTGLITCGYCGYSMRGSRNKNRHGTLYYYYCCPYKQKANRVNYAKTMECPSRNHRVEKVDNAVMSSVTQWLSDIDSWIAKVLGPEKDDDISHRAVLEQQLKDVKAGRDRLLILAQRGAASLEDIEAKLIELKANETKIFSALSSLARPNKPHIDKNHLNTWALKHFNELPSLSPHEKKLLVRQVVSKIVLTNEKVIIHPRFPSSH